MSGVFATGVRFINFARVFHGRDAMIAEYIGYTGSLLWLISLTVSNTFRLRVLNLMGATTFSVYGYLTQAYPVCIVNALIALVDVYHLVRLMSHRGFFSLLEIPANHSEFVKAFFNHYHKDIEKYYPHWRSINLENCQAIFTMHNLQPVGICLYEVKAPDIVEIKLDYMALKYKDLKGIASLYANYRQKWKDQGYREIMVPVFNRRYKRYLQSLGYTDESSGDQNFSHTDGSTGGHTLHKSLQ